jgi:hypothetical protein
LVVLPELTAFTPHEVVRFVRSYLSPESVVHVGEIAKSLVENSNGGIPQLLYNLLLDGSSWL